MKGIKGTFGKVVAGVEVVVTIAGCTGLACQRERGIVILLYVMLVLLLIRMVIACGHDALIDEVVHSFARLQSRRMQREE